MPYTLITGASNGIGREFAREFARRKSDMVLVARSESSL
ncbi:MAG: SDR family NAD(P)-dependent oxidoreductase, partial [Chlorobium phaeobacteroides]|nr:SDR family NAD(P)-dependent oxidoreductase [Chlorobium phaeobacteroides]